MMRLRTLSIDELGRSSGQWDELWRSSAVREPTVTAEGVRLWHEMFAPESEFRALVVEQDDRFLAGLPLCSRRAFEFLPAWGLPTNGTVNSADLLLAEEERSDAELLAWIGLLWDGFQQLPHPVGRFENIPLSSRRWQLFFDHLRAEDADFHLQPTSEVGVVDIRHDWEAYVQSWSGNHRSAIKRSLKKIEQQGKLEVVRIRQPDDDELETLLDACIAVEDLGWKGENGTSILRTDGMRDYYLREAKMARSLKMLDLWLLKLAGRMIAFEYCHFAKGTCYSHKISFDPEYRQFGPGRLLRYFQLQAYHTDAEAELLDTMGLLCEAKAKWVTRTYPVGRCLLAGNDLYSRATVRAYRLAKPLVHRLRGKPVAAELPKLGAARYLDLTS